MTQLVMFDYTGSMANEPKRERAKAAPPPALDPVGTLEIGERLGQRPQTVAQWNHRGLLPPHRWTVSGRPAWNWPDIEDWADASGKLPERLQRQRARARKEAAK